MTGPGTTPDTAPATVPASTAIEAIRRRMTARQWRTVITEDGSALLVDPAADDPEQVVIAELLARNIEPFRVALEEEGPALLGEIDRLRALVAAPHPLLGELAVLFARYAEPGRDRPDGTGGADAVEEADNAVARTARRGRYGPVTWADLMATHTAVAAGAQTPQALRAELLQLAVTALMWADALDRRAPAGGAA